MGRGLVLEGLWEGLWMKGTAEEFSIQPAEHANLSRAETLQPAVDQKRIPRLRRRNLLGFCHD